MTKTILFLAYEGVTALDVVGPMQVFATAAGHARALGRPAAYDVIVASPGGGHVRTSTGLDLTARALTDIPGDGIDTLMVPGGRNVMDGLPSDPAVLSWLAANAPAARRVCSVCVGAFLLGEAGLLDGRAATTHWRFIPALRDRCPKAEVREGPIFVRDGDVWTSAGVSAGIDLALHLVEEDEGRKLAMDVAKTLVVYFRRPGNQHQFSTRLELQATADPDFSALLAWASSRLGGDLSVDALARQAGMSPRSFSRKFRAAVGATPAATIERMRFDEAKRLLEEGDLPLKKIAAVSGFADEQALRRAFRRIADTTPAEYRERFR